MRLIKNRIRILHVSLAIFYLLANFRLISNTSAVSLILSSTLYLALKQINFLVLSTIINFQHFKRPIQNYNRSYTYHHLLRYNYVCWSSLNTIRLFIAIFIKQHLDQIRSDVTQYHNLAHPGIRVNNKHFMYICLASNEQSVKCQKTKIHRHTHSRFQRFGIAFERFQFVHIDI